MANASLPAARSDVLEIGTTRFSRVWYLFFKMVADAIVIGGKTLIAPTQLTASNATYFTATAGTLIDKFTATNSTGTARTITFYLVPSGGTAGASNMVISARSVAAGETYTCPEVVGHYLNSGDTIQGLASAATAISIRSSGREVPT